jgi:hypothetical protein
MFSIESARIVTQCHYKWERMKNKYFKEKPPNTIEEGLTQVQQLCLCSSTISSFHNSYI